MSEQKIRRMGVSFNCRAGKLLIYRATLEAIGLPEFYHFLFSPNEKRFAIEACDMNDPGAYRFSGLPRSRRRSYQQTSLGLLEGLYERCSWDKAKTYMAEGEVLFGGKMVLFDLKEAQVERKE